MLKYKLILSILLFAVVSAKSYAERIITLRVNDSYAPFEYLNKDGKPIGFSIEIFNALNNINKFEYTTQANKGIFNFHSTTLDSTDIATSMDSVPHNSNFITSHPFGYIDNDIVVRVFSEIHSLNDLDGKTVLIVKNSPMILYIKQRNIKVDFVFIKNVPDGLRLLSSGKYDAMITSNDAAYFYINKHNLQNLSVRRLFCQPLSIKFVMLNICWRREWQPTPVFFPGEFHRQSSLAGCSPWDHKELDMTEELSFRSGKTSSTSKEDSSEFRGSVSPASLESS